MLKWLIAGTLVLAQAQAQDRTYEGKWHIADTTDNNTGDRKVYAFQLFISNSDPNLVIFTLRCAVDRPVFAVEWDNVSFPEEAVLSITPLGPDAATGRQSYVFSKSEGSKKDEIEASPETSARIIADLGTAPQASFTAHHPYGSRTVVVAVEGVQRAWSRVSRHCPVQKVARPPV